MADGSRVNVGTSATPIVAAASDRHKTIIRNRGSVSIDIGGPGVTVGTGFELEVGYALALPAAPGDTVYGIATQTCRVDVFSTVVT
jgi:hypothetical protein